MLYVKRLAVKDTRSSSENEDSFEDEESTYTNESQGTMSKESSPEPITFKTLFPTMKEVYGTELKKPSQEDILTYKKYVLIGKKANGTAKNIFTPTSVSMKSLGELPTDTCFKVTPPTISQKSINIYKNYISIGINGGCNPKPSDMAIYRKYASYK